MVCASSTLPVIRVDKAVGLTGFVIIHVFIASFSPAQGERNQMVNATFTRPVNAMPKSSLKALWEMLGIDQGAGRVHPRSLQRPLLPHRPTGLGQHLHRGRAW